LAPGHYAVNDVDLVFEAGKQYEYGATRRSVIVYGHI
jgi:hypothetical protein